MQGIAISHSFESWMRNEREALALKNPRLLNTDIVQLQQNEMLRNR